MSAIEDNISRISKEQWTDGYQQGGADKIDEILAICHHAYSVSEVVETLKKLKEQK